MFHSRIGRFRWPFCDLIQPDFDLRVELFNYLISVELYHWNFSEKWNARSVATPSTQQTPNIALRFNQKSYQKSNQKSSQNQTDHFNSIEFIANFSFYLTQFHCSRVVASSSVFQWRHQCSSRAIPEQFRSNSGAIPKHGRFLNEAHFNLKIGICSKWIQSVFSTDRTGAVPEQSSAIIPFNPL